MNLRLLTHTNTVMKEVKKIKEIKEIKEDIYEYSIKNNILIINKNQRYFNSFSLHYIKDIDREVVSSEFIKWLQLNPERLTYRKMLDKIIEINKYLL